MIVFFIFNQPFVTADIGSKQVSALVSDEVRVLVKVGVEPVPVSERVWQRSGWMICLPLLVAVAAAVWIVSDSLADIVRVGLDDPESSHIVLVPLVFVWIAWVNRGRLLECDFQGRWIGTVMIAAGWALWTQGYRYQIQAFWHLGAIIVVTGTAITVLGKDLLWKFFPAWASLLFMIPLPGRVHWYMAVPMEQVTAMMTQSVAEVLGINSTLSGNQLTVNGVAVSIAEACSGLRMVVTLFLACYLFAFIRPHQWWVRLIVLAASPVVAIVCNVIRLVPTLWVFGHASPAAAERFHDIAAWSMLLIAFALLTGITNLLNWTGLPVYCNAKVPALQLV